MTDIINTLDRIIYNQLKQGNHTALIEVRAYINTLEGKLSQIKQTCEIESPGHVKVIKIKEIVEGKG